MDAAVKVINGQSTKIATSFLKKAHTEGDHEDIRHAIEEMSFLMHRYGIGIKTAMNGENKNQN